jgi:glycosyltransferase involved in cell wall biosynthesis
MTPFVSIIIPTFNREKMLCKTLDSFLHQDFPLGTFQILVCNNNSTDNTQDVINEYAMKFPNLIIPVFEKRQGVHFARNTSALKAEGNWLYFTDDDMVAEPDLLEKLFSPCKLFPELGVLTGKVLPLWEVSPPDWILEHCQNGYLSLQLRNERLIISPSDVGVYSCHEAIRKDVFFSAGGFNPENTAGSWIGDGETGLSIKLEKAGAIFGFVGNSVIHHMIPETRLTQEYLNGRYANQASSDACTEFRSGTSSTSALFKSASLWLIRAPIYLSICLFYRTMMNSKWHVFRAKFSYSIQMFRYKIKLIYDQELQQLLLEDDWLSEKNNG